MADELTLEEQKAAEEAETAKEKEQPSEKGDESRVVPESPEEGAEDFEEIVATRGAKNVIEENRRKAKEAADLKTKVAAMEAEIVALKTNKPAEKADDGIPAGTPQEINEYEAEMESLGYSKEFIAKQRKAMIQTAASMVDFRLQKADKVIYKDDLDASIETLKADDKYKFSISKLEPKLRVMAMKHPGQYWKETDFIKTLLGSLIADNQNELFGTAKPAATKPDLPIEGEPEHSGGQGGKYTEKELTAYADELGVQMDSSETRRKVKEALLMRKKAMATLEKE